MLDLFHKERHRHLQIPQRFGDCATVIQLNPGIVYANSDDVSRPVSGNIQDAGSRSIEVF